MRWDRLGPGMREWTGGWYSIRRVTAPALLGTTAAIHADRAVGIRRRRPDGPSTPPTPRSRTEVLMTQLIPFGPVLHARAAWLGEHRPAAGRLSRERLV